MRKKARLVGVTGFFTLVVLLGVGSAAERDLYTGLALLRAGAQTEAALDLMRYRDASTDPEVRRRIDHVLPLLKQPLPPDVREYIALTLEPGGRGRTARADRAVAEYWLRMFPVFP